ncbi:MAG: hypothetical protein Q9187_006089 [Circinaria calcarea]
MDSLFGLGVFLLEEETQPYTYSRGSSFFTDQTHNAPSSLTDDSARYTADDVVRAPNQDNLLPAATPLTIESLAAHEQSIILTNEGEEQLKQTAFEQLQATLESLGVILPVSVISKMLPGYDSPTSLGSLLASGEAYTTDDSASESIADTIILSLPPDGSCILDISRDGDSRDG